jgi:hypothetical protein
MCIESIEPEETLPEFTALFPISPETIVPDRIVGLANTPEARWLIPI